MFAARLPPDAKYVVVGILTALVSIVLLGVLVEVVGISAIPANLIQWILTTYLNFALVCTWVYYADPFSLKLAMSNFAARGGTFVSVQLAFASLTMLTVHYYVAYIISALGGFIGNYLLARSVVFRQQRKEMM